MDIYVNENKQREIEINKLSNWTDIEACSTLFLRINILLDHICYKLESLLLLVMFAIDLALSYQAQFKNLWVKNVNKVKQKYTTHNIKGVPHNKWSLVKPQR